MVKVYNNALPFADHADKKKKPKKLGKFLKKVGKGIGKVAKVAIPVAAGLVLGGVALKAGGKVVQNIKANKAAKQSATSLGGSITKGASNPLPTKTPIPDTKMSLGSSIAEGAANVSFPSRKKSPRPVVDAIKRAANKINPAKVEKGKKLLQSGKGMISQAQKQFQAGATDPARLPKTKALKEAEQTLALPTEEAPEQSADIRGFWETVQDGLPIKF